MTPDMIVPRVQQIEALVRERRFDLALTLTVSLEEDLANPELDENVSMQPLRDLVHASRLFTETLLRLRDLQVH